MAYNLDKRTARIAGQTAKKVFNVGVAIVGVALGATTTSKRAPRKREPKWW